MLKRTLTGAALMTVLITVLLFLPTIYTALLVAVMVMIAADELMRTTGLVKNPRLISYASLMGICVAFGSYFELGYPIKLAVCLLLVTLCLSELLVSHGKLPFQQIAITLIAGLLIPFMLSSLVRLQMMENGRFLVVAVFIMAFMPDVGAYLVGSAIGKHKLCPNISPKKTVEGLIGGILGGIVGMILFAVVLRYAFGLSVNYLYMGIYGVVGAGAATFGDLIFSVIKRQAGIKDYGKLLPGHGGILDRFDSVAMVGPVAELLFLILPLAVR